jgi:hypothetical protein
MVTSRKIGVTYPQHLIFGLRVNSLTLLITNSLITEWVTLQEEKFDSKLVCFNANGVNIFQALNLKL